MNFTEKNQNRKAHSVAVAEGNRRQALDARDARRAVGGAFGNLDRADFNRLAFGTTGKREG